METSDLPEMTTGELKALAERRMKRTDGKKKEPGSSPMGPFEAGVVILSEHVFEEAVDFRSKGAAFYVVADKMVREAENGQDEGRFEDWSGLLVQDGGTYKVRVDGEVQWEGASDDPRPWAGVDMRMKEVKGQGSEAGEEVEHLELIIRKPEDVWKLKATCWRKGEGKIVAEFEGKEVEGEIVWGRAGEDEMGIGGGVSVIGLSQELRDYDGYSTTNESIGSSVERRAFVLDDKKLAAINELRGRKKGFRLISLARALTGGSTVTAKEVANISGAGLDEAWAQRMLDDPKLYVLQAREESVLGEVKDDKVIEEKPKVLWVGMSDGSWAPEGQWYLVYGDLGVMKLGTSRMVSLLLRKDQVKSIDVGKQD